MKYTDDLSSCAIVHSACFFDFPGEKIVFAEGKHCTVSTFVNLSRVSCSSLNL